MSSATEYGLNFHVAFVLRSWFSLHKLLRHFMIVKLGCGSNFDSWISRFLSLHQSEFSLILKCQLLTLKQTHFTTKLSFLLDQTLNTNHMKRIQAQVIEGWWCLQTVQTFCLVAKQQLIKFSLTLSSWSSVKGLGGTTSKWGFRIFCFCLISSSLRRLSMARFCFCFNSISLQYVTIVRSSSMSIDVGVSDGFNNLPSCLVWSWLLYFVQESISNGVWSWSQKAWRIKQIRKPEN